MERCESHYTGTPIICYFTNPRTQPHTLPRLHVSRRVIMYPCPRRSMERREPKYTGTPIIRLPVEYFHQPTDEAPHDNTPGYMYHGVGDYLSMHYHYIYYGGSKSKN